MMLSLVLSLVTLGIAVVVGTELRRRMAGLERELASLRALLATRPGMPAEQTLGPSLQRPLYDEEPDRTLATWFERLVGGRLLIWVGGIALAAGGVFLIRHSIDLVTPAARMVAAALLGAALIGAGEVARAGRWLADDPRIGQALVGAGIAVLYAAAYGSHILFGLIAVGTAFALMVAITAAALALALRHGAPTAAIGLAGGFLTPLLVGERDADAVQVLVHLALLDLALLALAWRRGWTWLGAAALAGSLAWTGYFMLEPPTDALPAGWFAALLGVGAALAGAALAWVPLVALVELAVLVGREDIGPLAWLLFAGVSAASLWAGRRPEHALLPAAALLITLMLLAVQAAMTRDLLLPWAAAVTTILFAAASLPAAAKGSNAAALTACAALAGPLLIVRLLEPALWRPEIYGLLGVALAGAAFALLLLVRRHQPEAGPSFGGFGAATTATLLLAVGSSDLAPRDFISAAWLAIATGLLLAGIRLRDTPLRVAGLALLTMTVCKVFLIDAAELEGVLRILSFLGLGIALIGIGLLYGRVLRAKSRPAA